MSRGSERSLVTSRGATKHAGTKHGGSNSGGGGSNTKCIVTIGIILPLVAAIIGVAAWSVSSDSVHRRAPSTTVYHIGRSSYRNGDPIFEERNDEDDLVFGKKVPIGGAVSKDVLGPDLEEERDILPTANEPPAQNDPLYVVHYVPRGPQDATSEPSAPSPAPDVLSKILQSGKGAGKGTPQFVVFAPTANEEDYFDDRSTEERSRKRSSRKRKKPRKDLDYEEDEYTENTRVRQQKVPAVPRNGYYDPTSDGPGWTPNFNGNQQNQQPCCNNGGSGGGGGGGGGMMPHRPAGGMMTTQAPSQGGISITLGQGLPLGPLGILRQILRPKVDLKKKLFFGVQLENGIGFGGQNNAGGGQMNQGSMGGMGQMNQGNMGHMGGGMGQQGGGGGGGGMGQQGGGGGITYTFG